MNSVSVNFDMYTSRTFNTPMYKADISDDYMQKHTCSEKMDFSKGYEIKQMYFVSNEIWYS